MAEPIIVHCPQCDGFGFVRTLADQPVRCSTCQGHYANLGFVDDDIVSWPSAFAGQTKQVSRTVYRWLGYGYDLTLMVIGIVGIAAVYPLLLE
ncbi:MAG: hypothetical protein ACD_41C00232G0001, partial [uncultured bacterium]